MIASAKQFPIQSPHPRQYLTSTMFGSDTSMRNIALRVQAFAAEQSEHRMHLSGLMEANKVHSLHNARLRFLILANRATTEKPNRINRTTNFLDSKDCANEFASNPPGMSSKTTYAKIIIVVTNFLLEPGRVLAPKNIIESFVKPFVHDWQ